MFSRSRSWSVPVLALTLSIARTGQAADDPALSAVKLNQIQVIGSHNSYHVAPHADLSAMIESARKGGGKALAYSHPPLPEQFHNRGIRQIELDIFADPQGGRFASPKARKSLQLLGKNPGPDPNVDGVLNKPGIKILHIPDVDYGVTVPTLNAALKQVREWSRAHPRHVPLFILLELKDGAALSPPAPFDKAALDGLDAEILSVFERTEILTPDDVRGDHATLPGALKVHGWPALDDVRGKVMFALDNEDKVRDAYLDGHFASKGRLLFVSVPETDPSAGWMKVNDPVRSFDKIKGLVSRGYLVRTRADADTAQARKNDTGLRDKALASGAQYVSTDYPVPDPSLSDYVVRLPGGVVARANPVSGDPALGGIDLETGIKP